jgi:Ca2+:H+ antiporter
MLRWLWRAAWLLVPAAFIVHRVFHHEAAAFVVACLSLIPLARSMGDATEELAERLGPAAGGLLNATFGNAAELIVGIFAVVHGHLELVKGSISGSIIANMLLVGGGAMFAGSLRRKRAVFNRTAAGASVSLLFLALVAMATPTLIKSMHERDRDFSVRGLSIAISALLLAMYALSLFFQLRTHAELLGPPAEAEAEAGPEGGSRARLWRPLMLLAGAGLATAVSSEVLVSALEGALVVFKLPEAFVGVVIVAIAGNAAEHSTAVTLAYKGQLDVGLGIAWESSKQIVLFVAPVLVLFAVAVGAPLDLAFRPFEVAAVAVAVIATALVALDGETNWLEGAFLIFVYAVLALGLYFVQ